MNDVAPAPSPRAFPGGRGGCARLVCLILGYLLLSGCAVHRTALPRWVEQPPRDDAYLYAVGTRTGAATIEEARRGAIEHAVGELVHRFGVASQTSYEEVRTQLETRVRDEIRAESSRIQIKDAVVQDWSLRHTPSGYDAFVLLRYPRQQAEHEQARLRAEEGAALHAAHQALRRGDVARERGEVGTAMRAYCEAARVPGDSAGSTALHVQALDRLSALASTLRIEPLSGAEQRARIFAPLVEPLLVRASLGDTPAAGLPLRFRVLNGEASLSPERIATSPDGTAAATVTRVRSLAGNLVIRAEPDVAALCQAGTNVANPATENVRQAIGEHGTEFRIPADQTRRPLRVAVLIDERDGGIRMRRSIVAAAVAGKLQQAGFRVVADHELGKTNTRLLRQAFDRDEFFSLSPVLARLVDIAVGGWCETRPGSDNLGWAVSILADGDLRAVSLGSGEVVATHRVVGRAGFGERKDRARIEALRGVAEEIAEELVAQLAAQEPTLTEPAPYFAPWQGGNERGEVPSGKTESDAETNGAVDEGQ